MKTYDVQISETYKCIATVAANNEKEALQMVKKLYEDGCLELDNEDITATEYEVI